MLDWFFLLCINWNLLQYLDLLLNLSSFLRIRFHQIQFFQSLSIPAKQSESLFSFIVILRDVLFPLIVSHSSTSSCIFLVINFLSKVALSKFLSSNIQHLGTLKTLINGFLRREEVGGEKGREILARGEGRIGIQINKKIQRNNSRF